MRNNDARMTGKLEAEVRYRTDAVGTLWRHTARAAHHCRQGQVVHHHGDGGEGLFCLHRKNSDQLPRRTRQVQGGDSPRRMRAVLGRVVTVACCLLLVASGEVRSSLQGNWPRSTRVVSG